MDIVFIRDLRVDTVIGIYDWERRIRQTVIFDLEMGADIARAAATDAIEDTLDYKAVSKRLVTYVQESEFQLVETLAERCAEIVLREFNVPWVRLTLNKVGAVSAARDVGVVIERGQGD
jgi:dihydroneopterin aldolase